MPSSQSTHYEVLGVAPTASTDEIKRAYRSLARLLHPDINPDPEAQEHFKFVNLAYEVLSSAQKRESYDLELATARRERERRQDRQEQAWRMRESPPRQNPPPQPEPSSWQQEPPPWKPRPSGTTYRLTHAAQSSPTQEELRRLWAYVQGPAVEYAKRQLRGWAGRKLMSLGEDILSRGSELAQGEYDRRVRTRDREYYDERDGRYDDRYDDDDEYYDEEDDEDYDDEPPPMTRAEYMRAREEYMREYKRRRRRGW